jgi:enoyl-CoA hydratase/carnithine racemase
MIETLQLKDSIFEIKERVATLTLNRNDVRNALTGTALIDEICRVAEWINSNDAVSVLIITGAGGAFSSGGNVKDMASQAGDFSGSSSEIHNKYRAGIQRIPKAIDSIEVPVIAAVNGAAIGAGFDLANMADIRLASSSAKFGETFINLGLIPGDGGWWFLQKIVGHQRAAELTLTGRVIDAEEAKTLGIVLDVYEPNQLLVAAYALAATIAKKPPKTVRLTKRLMKKSNELSLSSYLEFCACFQSYCHSEDEHLQAVNDFIDKSKSG